MLLGSPESVKVKGLKDYSDRRLKNACAQCGTGIRKDNKSRDHVPSKCLLRASEGAADDEYPSNLPVAFTCRDCNQQFARDEQYLCVFLNCVLAGSTDPEDHDEQGVQGVLEQHEGLRARIEASKRSETRDGEVLLTWIPELERVHRVVVKNARGHAFYEFGQPVLEEPEHVWAMPLARMTETGRLNLETGSPGLAGWPEVGSRMMERLATGLNMRDGWVVVQPSVYRYRVEHDDGLVVRTILREYLATEVYWA